MSDEQGRTTAAAEAMEDAAFRWIGRDLGTVHRDDIAAEALAAADRWDREHGGYVRINAATLAEALREAGVEVGSVGGEAFRMHIATHAVAAVLRAAGEDQ